MKKLLPLLLLCLCACTDYKLKDEHNNVYVLSINASSAYAVGDTVYIANWGDGVGFVPANEDAVRMVITEIR